MPALKNPKHEAFCREVAGGASHAHAWVLSGNSAKANNVGRLMRDERVQKRIEELRAEFNLAAGIQLRWLQERLLPLATADVTAFFEHEEGGKLTMRDLTGLAPEVRAAISEISIDDDGKVTVKTHSKIAAIDSLIKTIGGYAKNDSVPPLGFTANVQLLQMVNKFDGMSNYDIARRVAFTLERARRELAAAETGTAPEAVSPRGDENAAPLGNCVLDGAAAEPSNLGSAAPVPPK